MKFTIWQAGYIHRINKLSFKCLVNYCTQMGSGWRRPIKGHIYKHTTNRMPMMHFQNVLGEETKKTKNK